MAPKESSEAPNMQWKYGSTLPGLICGTSTPRAVGNAERAQPSQKGWGGARRWRSSCQSWRRASRCTWPGSSPSGPAAGRPGSDVVPLAKMCRPEPPQRRSTAKRESRPVRAPRPPLPQRSQPPAWRQPHGGNRRLTCPSLENVKSLRRMLAMDAMSAAPALPKSEAPRGLVGRGGARHRGGQTSPANSCNAQPTASF